MASISPTKRLLLLLLAIQNSHAQADLTDPVSLAIFSNLQCKRGWICIDMDTTEALKYTDNLKRDLTFGTCDFESISTIQIDENTTRSCFNIDEGKCGIVPYTQTVNELEKHLRYDVEIELKSLMEHGGAGNFASIVTRKEKIYITPLSCSYQSKGNIVSGTQFYHLPKLVKEIETEQKTTEFSVRFFVSSDPNCEQKTSGASALDDLYMCIIATNVTDPDVKFTVNEIWATPTSNPQGKVRYSFYNGGCTFTDQEHEGGGGEAEDGEGGQSTGEHSLEEEIKMAISLGRAMKFTGYSTIYYHIDVSICMVEALCAMPCDLEAMVRSFSTPPSINAARPGIGRSTGVTIVDPKVAKTKELTQLKWLMKHGLPANTDLNLLYEYVDNENERIRQEHKQDGKSGTVHMLPLEEIIKSYRYRLKEEGFLRNKRSLRRSSKLTFSDKMELIASNRRSKRQVKRIKRSTLGAGSFGTGGVGGFSFGDSTLQHNNDNANSHKNNNNNHHNANTHHRNNHKNGLQHNTHNSHQQFNKINKEDMDTFELARYLGIGDTVPIPTVNFKSALGVTPQTPSSNNINPISLDFNTHQNLNLMEGFGDYTTQGTIYTSDPIYINSENMDSFDQTVYDGSLRRNGYDEDNSDIDSLLNPSSTFRDSGSNPNSNLNSPTFKINKNFKIEENLANIILFALIGVAAILMVVFLGLIIYNHNSKLRSKNVTQAQINIQKEIIANQIESGEISIDQLQSISQGGVSPMGTLEKGRHVTFR